MGPNFREARPWLVPAQLEVEGRFDTHGEVIGKNKLDMIIPADNTEALTEPITGIVTLTNDELTTRTPQRRQR